MAATTKTPNDNRDLERLKTAARFTGRSSQVAARAARRKRRMLAPVPVFPAVAALPALQLIPTWGGVALSLIATAAPAVVGWVAWKTARLRYITTTWAAGWATFASGWLIASMFINPYTMWALFTLKAGWLAAFTPWWWRYHTPVPTLAQQRGETEPPPAEPEPEPLEHIPWQVELYNQHLAAPNRQLAGTWVDGLEPIPYGFQLKVHWPIGRTYDELWSDSVLRAIRSVYDVPDTQISKETLPGRPPREARLMVLTQDPLRQVIDWQGPNLDEGVAHVGLYADGRPVPWRFWERDGGACHGLVYGCSGSGKSKLLALLMITVLRSDWMTPWFLDGQNGASSPTLMHYVQRVGRGPDDSLTRLREIKAIMDDRSARMPYLPWRDGRDRPRKGVGKITPSRELPQIVVFMDEAQLTLATSEAAQIVGEIVATGRKVGISLVLLTQVPSAGNLNSLTGMREQLKAFNVLVLRLREHFTTNMGFSGTLQPPPHELPEWFDDGSRTHGLGYKPDDRLMMMRCAHVTDDDEMDWVAERRVDVPMEPEAVRACEGTQAAAPAGPAENTRVGADVTDMIADARSRLLGQPQTADSGGRTSNPGDSRAAIVNYLEDYESVATGDIVEDLGISRATVHRVLNELVNDGTIIRPSKGLYKIANPETE